MWKGTGPTCACIDHLTCAYARSTVEHAYLLYNYERDTSKTSRTQELTHLRMQRLSGAQRSAILEWHLPPQNSALGRRTKVLPPSNGTFHQLARVQARHSPRAQASAMPEGHRSHLFACKVDNRTRLFSLFRGHVQNRVEWIQLRWSSPQIRSRKPAGPWIQTWRKQRGFLRS